MYPVRISRRTIEGIIAKQRGDLHNRILRSLPNFDFYREVKRNYESILASAFKENFIHGMRLNISIEQQIVELYIEDQTEALMFKLRHVA